MSEDNKHQLYLTKRKDKGELLMKYSPLENLIQDNKTLSAFNTDKLNFDLEHPVDILTLDSYDGSVNLILNDDKNPPRLINSRFSVLNDTQYNIPEHYGFKDSNVYDVNTFDIDTRLKPIYRQIPTLTFTGLSENTGKLPCGSYSFYFKYADIDGNETEICQESGIVQVHIGNDSSDSRMGLEDESSNKSVKFKLTNIDTGFDYIHVLYARESSGQALAGITTYHKISYDYPIYNGNCEIDITGYENIINITQAEFYTDLADINSAKTQAVSQNVLLLGNVSKTEHDWSEIKKMSWKIIPSYVQMEVGDVGSLDSLDYKDNDYIDNVKINNNYYNSQNVYTSVGYWPDEIYRFGIVYIFDDNSVSPVFNLLGCVLQNKKDVNAADFFASDGTEYDYEPGNSENEIDGSNSTSNSYFFNINKKTNSKGVIKFPAISNYTLKGHRLQSLPLGISFDFSYINTRQIATTDNQLSKDIPVIGTKSQDILAIFKKHHIMGFFFVRQKRVPTILAQGIVVGLTDRFRGAIPVIQTKNQFVAQSFIGADRALHDKGVFVHIPTETIKNQALFVPDAEMSEVLFNDLFVSNDYYLTKVGSATFTSTSDTYVYATEVHTPKSEQSELVKLLNVPTDVSLLTNGNDYFSTRAGNASEPYKTSDVLHPWRWTLPQELTESTSVVRGLYGPYVGMSKNSFAYGDIVNIKKAIYKNPEADINEFKSRFFDLNFYHSISNRINISDLDLSKHITCFRGDCFTTLFTHRVNRNFIDPELPTNNKIVDPSCWRTNYGVRNTASIITHAHSNLTKDSEGWFEEPPGKTMDWGVFATLLCTGNIIGALVSLKNLNKSDEEINEIAGLNVTNLQEYQDSIDITPQMEVLVLDEDEEQIKKNLPKWATQYYPNGMANEVVTAFEVHMSKEYQGQPLKKKLTPKEQEKDSGVGGIIKAMFTPDDGWELHGIASINRADVNAVGLGLWITFPICSSKNLSFRDIDFSNATEEAAFNKKRSFFPLQKINLHNPLADSNIINHAAGVSIPAKNYFIFPDVPYIKQEYFTRVLCSLRDSADSITNEFKLILESAYVDYDKQYGQITKLVAIPNAVAVIFSHGIGILSILNSMNVNEFLPLLLQMISSDFGSTWSDSIISTSRGIVGDFSIYGVDSVAKKIWKLTNKGLSLISDHKMGKFLIDNIDMSELDTTQYIGHRNIKTHYNAFKHDVIFTYYNDKYTKTEKTINISTYLKEHQVELDPVILTITRRGKGRKGASEITLVGKVKKTEQGYYLLLINNKLTYLTSAEFNINKYPNCLFVDDILYYTPNIDLSSMTKTEWSWEPGKSWSLCYNEDTDMFTTFYDWIPVMSENIDNIWFSFDKEKFNEVYEKNNSELILWKHGQGGIYNNQGDIKPTTWYGKQHEFNFEFVVNKLASVLKIFNNLKILSNKVEPAKFEFEVVGEGYDWYEYKQIITWIYKTAKYNPFNIETSKVNVDTLYKEVLSKPYGELKEIYKDFPTLFNYLQTDYIKKLPYLKSKEFIIPGLRYSERYELGTGILNPINPNISTNKTDKSVLYNKNNSETMIIYDSQLNENRIRVELMGNNIKKFGRATGNMQYLEDLWDVEIRPIAFKFAYISNDELKFSKTFETRLRDKFMKVKVRYTGKDLSVIQAIMTTFDYSFA